LQLLFGLVNACSVQDLLGVMLLFDCCHILVRYEASASVERNILQRMAGPCCAKEHYLLHGKCSALHWLCAVLSRSNPSEEVSADNKHMCMIYSPPGELNPNPGPGSSTRSANVCCVFGFLLLPFSIVAERQNDSAGRWAE
jgi:hypothetical protein